MHHGDWAPINIAAAFRDAKERKRVTDMMESVTLETMASDAGAFFDYIHCLPRGNRGAVRRKIGRAHV